MSVGEDHTKEVYFESRIPHISNQTWIDAKVLGAVASVLSPPTNYRLVGND